MENNAIFMTVHSDYQSNIRSVDREKRELLAHAEFFREGTPTEDEIDEGPDEMFRFVKVMKQASL